MILWWHVVYTSQSFGRVYQTLPVVIDLAQICAVSQARLIPSALVVMAKSAKPEWASNPLALTKSQASLLLKLGAPLLLLLAENINDINSLDIFPPVFFPPTQFSISNPRAADLAQATSMWFCGILQFWASGLCLNRRGCMYKESWNSTCVFLGQGHPRLFFGWSIHLQRILPHT